MPALFFILGELICTKQNVAKFDKMSLERFCQNAIWMPTRITFILKAVDVHGTSVKGMACFVKVSKESSLLVEYSSL